MAPTRRRTATARHLLLLAALGAAPALGARSAAGASRAAAAGDASAAHEVYLLVTRHGLSCSNMVQKWVSTFDFGRARIFDPLLSGAAWSHAKHARAAQKAWLENRSLTLDGVVSSVMERAMETAILTYPQGTAAPLYTVPYIREHGAGPSNSPKDQNTQVDDLTEALEPGGEPFRLDFRWTDVFGRDEISWDTFEEFMAQSFLPWFVQAKGKRPGSPIVLGVVTHSNFVKHSKLGGKCSQFWTSQGESKPLNNQILVVPYTFQVDNPLPTSVDSTKRYTLVDSTLEGGERCGEAFRGAQLKDDTGNYGSLCLQDIGEGCMDVISKHSLSPSTLYKQTPEAAMLKIAKKIIKLNEKIEQDKTALAELAPTRLPEEIDGSSSDDECGVDCLQAKIQRSEAERAEEVSSLETLRKSECEADGHPDVEEFCRFQGDRWPACTPERIAVAVGKAQLA